uniref:Uncharacterized protein n=1 Tax=Tanacetum cinerariifolium TaxID=118510 RepID=A0A699I1Q5_TANCI|nr:hypothetical protein [Tanacetum cinerariifolium]
MEVIMELHEGDCSWLVTREVMEEGKGDDEKGNGEGGNEGAGGYGDIYRNMSQGYEVEYAPYGYHGHMPPSYTYRLDPS